MERWVYSDGTTWFLAKGWDEFEAGQQRAALGTHVWRTAHVVCHPARRAASRAGWLGRDYAFPHLKMSPLDSRGGTRGSPGQEEGPGEGHVKREENFEGVRGERDLAMEQCRPRAPVGLKGPGPCELYQLASVTAHHIKAIQAPCAQRGIEAKKSSLHCNAQRTLNVRSTHAQRTLNVTRNMLSSAVFQACSRVQNFLLREKNSFDGFAPFKTGTAEHVSCHVERALSVR